ncbi:TolC family protein [Pontibacter silvestris]|uniref:TolC family protein n=1 Tax=Pontibacter silvestris TaxID=2305183 RepID=A0ABW4WYV2_9BACT|nr:TolC family protein [Pontibacter silvestris]MCC9138450.1 TolC family protein [Pontibacter silvestris]
MKQLLSIPFNIFFSENKKKESSGKLYMLSLLILLLAFHSAAFSQNTRTISLQEAKELALEQNRLLSIAQEKVEESELKVTEARSRQYPLIYANGGYVYNGFSKDVTLPRGSLGVYPDQNVVVPQYDFPLLESRHSLIAANVVALQPITQLGKIKAGVRVAQSDVAIAETEVAKAEQQVKQGVEQLYYGLLITQKRQEEAQANIQLTEARLYDVESALLAGKTDEVNKIGLQAELASQQQKLLEISNQLEDYTFDLNETLGLPANTKLNLTEVQETTTALQPVEVYLQQAQKSNYDVRLAEENTQKAAHGVEAAKQDYIPSVSAVGGYMYQSVVSILPENNYFLGVQANWNILTFGRRKAVLNQRRSLQRQAEINLDRTKEQVEGRIAKAYRKIRQAQAMVSVAQKAVQYRRQELKLKEDRLAAGLNLKKDLLETQATLAKAEADFYSAQLNYNLALSELESATGAAE